VGDLVFCPQCGNLHPLLPAGLVFDGVKMRDMLFRLCRGRMVYVGLEGESQP
jgi:hypothetical protein